MENIRSKTIAAAMFAVGLGAASTAIAAADIPNFTVDPNSIPGTDASIFVADFVNGQSTTRVVFDSMNGSNFIYTAHGYITYQGFSLDSNPIGAGTTGLTVDYGLYAVFDQTFTCGSALAANVTCSVSSINLNVFADPGFLNTYVAATLTADPVVNDLGTTDMLLGTANTVFSGVAGIDEDGGAFENVTTNFSLTPNGQNYFIDPVPFFNLAFSNFNNTAQGMDVNTTGTIFAITNENGGTDFNRVPEPGALALFGFGILALAGTLRRRRS